MIVIHHIGSNKGRLYGVKGTVTWFTDINVHKNKKTGKIENKVSAHYILPRKNYQGHDTINLVSDGDVAYHAGYSQWTVNGKFRKGINKYSIGIEMEGDGNLVEYTDQQYDVLAELVRKYIDIYNISENNIVGHEDVSPGRKVDPGKFFDWKKFRTSLKPIVISMPEVTITPIESEKEQKVIMQGGEDTVGAPQNFISLLINLISKIFGK